MASRASTPQSRSRSSSGSSSSSDATMIDVPPQSPSRPVRLRHPSQTVSASSEATAAQPTATYGPSFSILLSLPRELRDRVYTFALTSSYPFWWPTKSPSKFLYDVNVDLLRANRQVYEEAAPILYSQNKLLFTHPSDCNIFRVIAAPASENIQSVYFRIREKDLRLWTSYMGSKSPDRSLRADLPKLKNLWIFMRCGSMGTPAMLGQLGGPHGLQGMQGLPPGVQMQVVAVQNALGQQVQALQQQTHDDTHAESDPDAEHGESSESPQTPQIVTVDVVVDDQNQVPPPPPPAPVPFTQLAQGAASIQQQAHHQVVVPPHIAHGQQNQVPPPPPVHIPTGLPHHHAHPLYTSFLRFEREMGIESLCLSLHDTLSERNETSKTEVKIVCIMRIPRREVERLTRLYPEELNVDKEGNARTRFRRLHGVEVSLELSGYPLPGE